MRMGKHDSSFFCHPWSESFLLNFYFLILKRDKQPAYPASLADLSSELVIESKKFLKNIRTKHMKVIFIKIIETEKIKR